MFKKILLIGLLISLIPITLLAQYNQDGRRINPATVGTTQLTADAVDGTKLYEPTRYAWYPCAVDSGETTGAGVLHGTGGWYLPSSNPASVTYQDFYTTIIFDSYSSDSDDLAYLTFVCPADYKVDSMELQLYWFHLDDDGAAADEVDWDGTVQAIGSAEDCFAGGTAMAVVATICTASDSALYITNLDPEVLAIAAGDLITVQLFVDASGCDLDSGEHTYLIGALVEWEAKEK